MSTFNSPAPRRSTLHAACLLLLGSAQLAAQPVITSVHSPQIGDQCPYTYSNDFFVFPTGPDQTWDFSMLSFTPVVIESYVTASTAPGHAHFPSANIAMVDDASDWTEYYIQSASSIQDIGGYDQSGDVWVTTSNPYLWTLYPCNSTSDWTDIYVYQWSDDPTVYQDTAHWTAISYGTLLMPGYYVPNVLALSQSFVDVDTVGTDVYTSTDQQIRLYTTSTRCPLATLSTSMLEVNGVPTDFFSSARVLDDATIGMAENHAAGDLELWPVPARGMLNLRSASMHGVVRIEVIDPAGRIVIARTLPAGEMANGTTVDVNGLDAGSYLLRTTDGDGAAVRRFVVE